MTTLRVKRGYSWPETYARCLATAPEAFEPDRIHNLIGGEWRRVGTPGHHVTPVDMTPIQGPPRVDHDTAVAAVEAAQQQHRQWGHVDLDERSSA